MKGLNQMSVKGENWSKLVKLSSNHFLTANTKLWRKNLWLKAKTKASLKIGLKMEVVWNTCDKELGNEIKSVNKNCLNKSSLANFQNSLRFREIYANCLEKNSIATGIIYSYLFSFLYQFAMKSKACDTH